LIKDYLRIALVALQLKGPVAYPIIGNSFLAYSGNYDLNQVNLHLLVKCISFSFCGLLKINSSVKQISLVNY
jgi:hypothetical protein